MDLAVKIGAFCRELGDNALRAMAHDDNKEPVYERAEESLKAGQTGPELEADLDQLDEMVRKVTGQSLYPAATRGFGPLPGSERQTGAQWWACPRGRCSGRGRVLSGQAAPVCGATGEPLVPRPLPG